MANKTKVKGSLTREQAEANENVSQVIVDAPDQRLQRDQQRAQIDKTTVGNNNQSSFIKKKVKSKGATLKQEAVAEALGVKGAGGGVDSVSTASAYGLRAPSFSGDTGTLLGDASGTPAMKESYQGKSRVDKRMSDANKEINFNASEQVMVEYDAIPALADSESTVGYNGNPKNISARSQKKTGQSSAELLYDRSLDFVTKDAFVFSTGQVVKQEGSVSDEYPTKTVDMDGNVVAFTAQKRGNYSPRELKVKVKKSNGKTFINSFEIIEDDLSCNNEKDVVVNSSSTNNQIDVNRAELARQTIDADAGSPTSDHFNPLGRSVQQPTQTVTYLQDIENVTGAEVFASYKYANKARAHFLNRSIKDGQMLVDPAIDALYGHLVGAVDTDDITQALGDVEDYFSTAGMLKGSAAILIPLFDSVGKYKTKADLVNQARGLKLHLQTADNNMNPFHVKKEFVAALNSIDCYSTIDHEYDPTAPVYITDNVRLVHPYSWAKALKFTRDENGVKTYGSELFSYSYQAGSGQNSYIIRCGDPLLNGIAYFFDLHANALYNALASRKATTSAENEYTISIPIVHSTTHFSLWDLLVCASTPYIIYERTNCLKDILDYEMFYKYPFQGNVRIADANPLNAVNYSGLTPYTGITPQQMKPSSAMRWRYPETFLKVGSDVMLPWYFSEREFNLTGTNDAPKLTPNSEANFTTPVVRSGLKLAGLDEFFSMEVKDQLLITDRLTRVPGNNGLTDIAGYVYKYSQDSDGIPVVTSDYAVGVTARDVYATPRLLGWYMDAPAGSCSVIDYTGNKGKLGSLADLSTISLASMRPSFRAVQYKGVYADTDVIVDRPLQVGSVNISRAQSFKQVWGAKWAGFDRKSKYFDLVLSTNEAIEYNNENATSPRFVTISDGAQFSPYVLSKYAVTGSGSTRTTSNTAYSIDVEKRPILFSPHRFMWTLLQKLPFIINPFENSDSNRPAADPFGIAYTFGLAGFIAADYNEELYNRANAYQNQGYGYTSDPMVAQSPIFKDAYASTEIGTPSK